MHRPRSRARLPPLDPFPQVVLNLTTSAVVVRERGLLARGKLWRRRFRRHRPCPWPRVLHPKRIRDLEEWYVSTVARKEHVMDIFHRQLEVQMKNLEAYRQAVGDRIDVVFMSGTDFGSQGGPFIAPAAYREIFKPLHATMNGWVHERTEGKTFFHTCGSIVELLQDSKEAGIDILNAVQVSANGMEPRGLKGKWGKGFVFWGGALDAQHALPFGTPGAVPVRRALLRRHPLRGADGEVASRWPLPPGRGSPYTSTAMARATLADAREVTSSIVPVLDPEAVLVFGEVGRSGSGNDLDLLIVIDGEVADEAALTAVLRPFQKRIAIDPFVMPADTLRSHFRRGSPFLRTIIREGRQLYMKNAESEWMKDARNELESARYLCTGGFWKQACFHAQQALEKHVKARLLGKGWELEKVHSLARLEALAADHGIALAIPEPDLVFMDSIYRGRCPGEAGLLPLGEPSREDAERAVRIAASTLEM